MKLIIRREIKFVWESICNTRIDGTLAYSKIITHPVELASIPREREILYFKTPQELGKQNFRVNHVTYTIDNLDQNIIIDTVSEIYRINKFSFDKRGYDPNNTDLQFWVDTYLKLQGE